MTAPTKAWQYDLNRNPANDPTGAGGLEFAFSVKAWLKGERGGAILGIWSIYASSDGVTAGMDGVDRTGATWDPTKWNRALQSGQVNLTLTASTTGGTLASGTYFYTVVPVNANGLPQSPYYERSITVVGPNGSVSVTNWLSSITNGAISYRIYRGTAAGVYQGYFTILASAITATTVFDTGAVLTPGAPVSSGTNVGPQGGGLLINWSAHTWITLVSPPVTAGGIVNVSFYLTIDLYGTSDVVAGNYTFSKNPPTGGTIYLRPTATDEWNYAGIATIGASATVEHYHHWLTPDGSFIIGSTKQFPTNTIGIHTVVEFQILADSQATDLYPVLGWAAFYEGSAGGTFSTSLITSALKGRGWNGVATINSQFVYIKGNNDPASASNTSGDVQKTVQSFGELDVHIYTFDAGQQTYRGRLVDLYIACTDNSKNLQVEPAVGPPQSEIFGIWFIPVNAAVVM